MRQFSLSPEIQPLLREVVRLSKPLSVRLFGSALRPETKLGPYASDVDLLIIVPEGTHRRKTAQMLYRDITGVRVPFDLLVATPSDIEKYKDSPGLIYKSILREGMEIYVSN
jgi:uncharacterized protein